ncbi:hypothetical protein SK128_012989 [Halocaridina rubra]|uniref:Uncharacterized protein n=1 Tax=Halocaridina rubra TaxID=373956 RepID=A0AAN9AG82_HALRR
MNELRNPPWKELRNQPKDAPWNKLRKEPWSPPTREPQFPTSHHLGNFRTTKVIKQTKRGLASESISGRKNLSSKRPSRKNDLIWT